MLPIYYTVFGEPGATDGGTATIEVSREVRTVRAARSPMAVPDAAGRITGLSPIPLQKLHPGSYVVKVRVTKEGVEAEETTTVTVGP